jgi:hypothetical protein
MKNTQNGDLKAEIIRVDRILQSCQLLADPGKMMGTKWTADTALDRAPDFLFNDYFSVDMFAFVRFPSGK